jgi:phage terminase large subunit-like protein
MARKSTVQTHATTHANRAYLADSFLTEVQERYAGTRLGRQELYRVGSNACQGWHQRGFECLIF